MTTSRDTGTPARVPRRVLLPFLACLLAMLVPAAHGRSPRHRGPSPVPPIAGLAVEGPVVGLVVPGGRAAIAGVARCPGDGGTPGAALFLAAEALARDLAAPGEEAFSTVGGGDLPGTWIAVGGLAPGELAPLARSLLAPPRPRPESVTAAREIARARARAFAGDPLLRARSAAWARCFPGVPDPWSGWGTEEEQDAIPDGRVLDLATGLVAERLVVAGPGSASSGLAAVPRRAGATRGTASGGELPARVLIDREEGDRVAIVLAWRGEMPGAPLGRGSRELAELLVLAEALREGEGSLPQRVVVAAGEDALLASDAVVERGPGGVVLRLELVVRPPAARRALAILEGAVASVKELQLRRDAVMRARGRLDARAAALAGRPLAVLREAARGTLLAWPPPDRWKRPIAPADVLARARAFLRPERRVLAMAGPVDAGLVAALEADEAGGPLLRVPWEAFDPRRPDLRRESPAVRRARELLARLAPAGLPGEGEAFRAEYEVEVETPLGPGRHRLLVARSPAGISVRAEGRDWAVEGEEDDAGAEAWISRGDAGEAGPLPVPPGTVDLLAWVEPVLFAQGLLSGRLAPTRCGDHEIAAVLPGGRRIVLELDGHGMPAAARVYAPGKGKEPFRTVRYLSFRQVDGVSLAAELACRPRDGMEERRVLLSFVFGAAEPGVRGNGGQAPEGVETPEKELSGEQEGLE